MVENIKKIIRYKWKKEDVLFVSKKVVGQAAIWEKSVRIPKISLNNIFFKNLINKQASILQSIKKLIISGMIIQKDLIMQQKL